MLAFWRSLSPTGCLLGIWVFGVEWLDWPESFIGVESGQVSATLLVTKWCYTT